MAAKAIYVKDINTGDRIDDLFIAAEKTLAYSQKGSPYINLRLQDRTGEVDAKIWDNALAWDKVFKKGDVLRVQGRALSFKNAVQVSVTGLQKVNDSEVDIALFLPAAKRDRAEMFKELLGYCEQVKTPCLKALLNSFFQDEKIAALFQKAPAAKGFHHIYIGGLIEHTLSVVGLLKMAGEHYENLDKDLLITGGILHDIGKIYELSYERVVEYSDPGRLIGHIVMGLEMIDERIAAIPDFPKQTALELRHIILSHHGELEYGSPKRPKTLEALIVHFMDDMDAKVNAFQEYIRQPGTQESTWTSYHRLLERYLYKGAKVADDAGDAPADLL
ncbi:MAG: HD domain-containing protein [Syntrophobacterales bacterium]|nr:HD domain-containing protein [Syntrophobacterales bacterium]